MRTPIRAATVIFAICSLPGAGQTPTPMATCVEYDTANQVMVAHFGVAMPDRSPVVTIPVGTQNIVTPFSAVVHEQPTVFRAGSVLHSFLVVQRGGKLDSNAVTWTLGANSATLTANSAACPRAGSACWDTNHSGRCELESEDKNGDGRCTIADCLAPTGAAGPQGPVGPQGLPGPPGPGGAPGDPAFPATRFRMITSTAGDTAIATCPATERLLSGGASCNIPNRVANSGRIAASRPSGANGWEVTCALGEATAIAVCSSSSSNTGGNQ